MSPPGIETNVQDCGIVVSEVEFQSRYYVHFRIHTFEKGMNSLIPQVMDWIPPLMFFYISLLLNNPQMVHMPTNQPKKIIYI